MSVINKLLEISKNNPIKPSQLIRSKFVPVGMYFEIITLPSDTIPTYRFYRMEPVSDIVGDMTARRTTDDLLCRVDPKVLCRVVDHDLEKVLTVKELGNFKPDGSLKKTYVVVIYNIECIDGHDDIWLKDVEADVISLAGLRELIRQRLNLVMEDFDYHYCLETDLQSVVPKGEADGS